MEPFQQPKPNTSRTNCLVTSTSLKSLTRQFQSARRELPLTVARRSLYAHSRGWRQGLWVKLGQMLSGRADVMPEAYLRSVQHRVDPPLLPLIPHHSCQRAGASARKLQHASLAQVAISRCCCRRDDGRHRTASAPVRAHSFSWTQRAEAVPGHPASTPFRRGALSPHPMTASGACMVNARCWQPHSPCMRLYQIRRQIETELGAPLADIFLWVASRPMESRSE